MARLVPLSTMNCPVTGLSAGTTYYYRVRASNGGIDSPSTAPASATTWPPIPAAPVLLVTATTPTQITLSWNAVSGASGYHLYRGSSPGGEGATPLTGGTPLAATSYTDGGLSPSTTYYYFVQALNASGSSGASNEVRAATLSTLAPPQLNDGSAQRSMLTTITYRFSGPVALGPGAFTLTRRSDGLVFSVLSTPAADPASYASCYLLSFSGPGVLNGSLPDGAYDLLLQAAAVQDPLGQPLAGGDYALAFHRLYGDYDGNGKVNNTDLFWFKSTFARARGEVEYLQVLDYDGNGKVNNTDLFWFKAHFGQAITL
jgi:hypothetical protein